jgi:hypothetical protein
MEAGFNPVKLYYPKSSYVISICRSEAGDFQGKLFLPNAAKTITFLSAWGLLKQIEKDMLLNKYPQNTFEIRRWSKRDSVKKQKEERCKDVKFSKVICSFLVQIQYCQNATWQGSIHWMEGKQTKCFRSDLELLKLIEEASKAKAKRETHSVGEKIHESVRI